MNNPFEFFDKWYAAAESAKVIEPNAMVLSTVDDKNSPSSRVVLFKRFQENVFYFFTNYNSTKSKQLAKNSSACVNFHWRLPVHRQIRIEGKMIKASAALSDEYFSTRPRGSQIGAWASPQSQSIQNREELEKRVAGFEKQFNGRDVPRPEFWGGWGLVPSRFEFWEEGEYRLHTRIIFEKHQDTWVNCLVAP